jgi:hypothetical protein
MADDNGMKIHIDGQAYAFDDFELGDLEWLEDYIGRPLTDGSALNSMKAAVGFVYLVKRREDPAFTIDQARGVKMSSINEPDDKPAAKRPPKPAARS